MKKWKWNNSYRNLILILLAMSLILFVAGHFLLQKGDGNATAPPDMDGPSEGQTPILPDDPKEDAVKHIYRTETINKLKQEINILEIDLGVPGVGIKPVLSHDLIYGYEILSEMASRHNAYAAVNSGFFRDFGLPSGMVVIDGELYSAGTGDYPVFIIRDGKAELKEIDSKLSLVYGESTDAARNAWESIHLDNINFPASGKQTIVYTPAYGRYSRAETKNITAHVENGFVIKIADYTGEAEIPRNGMLISFFDTGRYAGIELPIKVGDAVKLVHEPDITGIEQAYECGCWLVKDGVSVVKERDPWIGVLTNRDPRTAIGIKADGTVILLTVDGRQPGYSAGFTGRELADYLISCGAVDAAMLDGGASTEMLLEGKLVSRPSFKGQEREIAGGIMIIN